MHAAMQLTFFRPWVKDRTFSLLALGVGGNGGSLYQNATIVMRKLTIAGRA